MEDDQSLGEVNATIGTSDTTEHFHVPVKEREAPASPSPVLTSVEEFHGGPVIISTHELPAPYGCRYAHEQEEVFQAPFSHEVYFELEEELQGDLERVIIC